MRPRSLIYQRVNCGVPVSKICFVAITAYRVLKGGQGFMGGAELQQVLLAHELKARGHDISFITMDHGQSKIETVEGIKVYSTFKQSDGVPGLRFFWPRVTSILTALNKSDAEIYYVRCAGFLLGLVVWWAKIYNKKVVYSCANDPEFDPKALKLNLRDKLMFFWGLRRCNVVITQNLYQKDLLKKNFNRIGVLIPNGFPGAEGLSCGINVLWVATFKPAKRPELYLELARSFPSVKFIMIGGPADLVSYNKIKADATHIPNLEFLGPLPFEKTDQEFSHARLFINTSTHEGFPNTFLQAWRVGVPVLSFVDPDDRIVQQKLGYIAKDFAEMRSILGDILSEPPKPRADIKSYFDQNLRIKSIVDKFESVLQS